MSPATDSGPLTPRAPGVDLGDVPLSPYGEASLTPAPVNHMMAAFAVDFRDGVDINLGVGFVNEATLPREPLRRALDAVLADPVRYRGALNYGGPAGSPNLIASVRRWVATVAGLPPAALAGRRVLIGPNGATSLLESLALLIGRGLVVVADPMYYIYCDYLRRCGFELLPIPEDEQGLSATALAAALDRLGPRRDEVRFVYVVTVHNPTGTVLSNGRRRLLAAQVTTLSRQLGRRVPLVVDRAYEDLIHDPSLEPGISLVPEDEAGIVYEVGTLSKILAPALRIGYLLAPPDPLVEALVQRTSDAGFSAPLVNQEIASWLLDECAAQQVRDVNTGYRHKAGVVRESLRRHLGDEIEALRGGQAGFYYYLTLREIDTGPDSPFFGYLSRTTGESRIDGPPGSPATRVVYIPGAFCAHPEGRLAAVGRRQLRISYAFEDLERIDAACGLMAQACAYARDSIRANETER